MVQQQPGELAVADVPQITPAEAAAVAVARFRFPATPAAVGPPPSVNEWKMVAVGYPLWLWADGPTRVGPVTDEVEGLSVALDAKITRTQFAMGDGHTVACTGAGKPWARWVQPGAKSPSCGYIYQQPSLPRGKYTVTATTTWTVTWRVQDQRGVLTVNRSSATQLPVGELQAVVTG